MATAELTASGMMSLARLQVAPLSPTSSSDRGHDSSNDSGNKGNSDNSILAVGSNDANNNSNENQYEHLDMQLSDADMEIVRDFEKAWNRFVHQKAEADLLPKGRRERHIEELQAAIRAIEEKHQQLDTESSKKLAFLRESTETLQFIYDTKMQKAEQEQEELYEQLTNYVDDVSEANAIREETFPWFHFLRQLDLEARKMVSMKQQPTENDHGRDISKLLDNESVASRMTASSQGSISEGKEENKDRRKLQRHNKAHPTTLQPSDRALYLAKQQQDVPTLATTGATREGEESDEQGVKKDILSSFSEENIDEKLRVYRIDHALLSAHVVMLHKEIERYEKQVKAQELAGNFLTQQNVWKILSTASESGEPPSKDIADGEYEHEKMFSDQENDDDSTTIDDASGFDLPQDKNDDDSSTVRTSTTTISVQKNKPFVETVERSDDSFSVASRSTASMKKNRSSSTRNERSEKNNDAMLMSRSSIRQETQLVPEGMEASNNNSFALNNDSSSAARDSHSTSDRRVLEP